MTMGRCIWPANALAVCLSMEKSTTKFLYGQIDIVHERR